MARLVLEHGGIRAEIEPRIGAGLAGLWWHVPGWGLTPVMRNAGEGVTWFNDLACYVLAPWSNRIAHGEFEWKGKRHRITPNWPDGTAIHGLVKDRAWTIRERSPVSAVLECAVAAGEPGGFAWGFLCRVSYEVGENSLRAVLEVRNESDAADPMPVGAGFHPFWLRALDGGSDEAVIRLAGLRRYPCEGMIPTGDASEDDVTVALGGASEHRPLSAAVGGTRWGSDGSEAGLEVGRMTLDDVFAGSAHGAEILWARSGVRARYRCSAELGHTVVFTGMAGSFCLEPVTMVNDGFNLVSRGVSGTGVREIGRAESLRLEWGVEFGRI